MDGGGIREKGDIVFKKIRNMSSNAFSPASTSGPSAPRLQDPAYRAKAEEQLEEEFQDAIPLGRYYDPPRQARISEMELLMKILDRKVRAEAALRQINEDLESYMKRHPQQVYIQMRDAVLGTSKKQKEKKQEEDKEDETMDLEDDQGKKKRKTGTAKK
jgi:hypothetical protein